MLQDHMKRILEQCRLQDDYAKDLDERGWFQILLFLILRHAGIQRGSRGPDLPRKITKLLGVLAILVHIPWKITKLPSHHSMLGQQTAI